MPLASKLAFQFERRLQFKGVNLYHARAVRITDANQAHLFGEVQGSSPYTIRLAHESGRLLVYWGKPARPAPCGFAATWTRMRDANRPTGRFTRRRPRRRKLLPGRST